MSQRVVSAIALLFALSDSAIAQDGAETFRVNCATCHRETEGAQAATAPSLEALRRFAPEAIRD